MSLFAGLELTDRLNECHTDPVDLRQTGFRETMLPSFERNARQMVNRLRNTACENVGEKNRKSRKRNSQQRKGGPATT